MLEQLNTDTIRPNWFDGCRVGLEQAEPNLKLHFPKPQSNSYWAKRYFSACHKRASGSDPVTIQG